MISMISMLSEDSPLILDFKVGVVVVVVVVVVIGGGVIMVVENNYFHLPLFYLIS